MYLMSGSVGAQALFLPIRRRIKKKKKKHCSLQLCALMVEDARENNPLPPGDLRRPTTLSVNIVTFFILIYKPDTLYISVRLLHV